MNPLSKLLNQQIRYNGPMSISQFMEICLLHPKYGYYTNSSPFGQKGDFVTAPEVSQMFGELIGLFLAQAWSDQKNLEEAVLVELGPGRGTLTADIMRVTKSIKNFPKKIYLLELSEKLKLLQKSNLEGYQVEWIKNLNQIPPGPIILIANEFFDSLPINQYLKGADGWHERLIGIKNGELAFGISEQKLNIQSTEYFTHAVKGDIVEVRPSVEPIITEISNKISQWGGISLIIDYGCWDLKGNTFQAIKSHKYINPLEKPGEVDLTAHVDFSSLARSVLNCSISKLTDQGVLLERLGISERANILSRSLKADDLENHIAAHRRLTHPNEMGTLFKVMAILPKLSRMPLGL